LPPYNATVRYLQIGEDNVVGTVEADEGGRDVTRTQLCVGARHHHNLVLAPVVNDHHRLPGRRVNHLDEGHVNSPLGELADDRGSRLVVANRGDQDAVAAPA
jgi:hypothetical protein